MRFFIVLYVGFMRFFIVQYVGFMRFFIVLYVGFMRFFHIFSTFSNSREACWPLVPKFAGSTPAEAVGFFRANKFLILMSSTCFEQEGSSSGIPLYEGGGKNNRNLNVARELELVARCAARCRESTQYSSSLPRGFRLG
jgi:hypothetical protein